MQRSIWLACVGLTIAASGAHAVGSIVLLDEYWAPEIAINDVQASELDALAAGDKAQAKSGEFSARLANETGVPNVRFRGAASVRLDRLPIGDTEARLWYRTDRWTGAWRMEVWIWHDALTGAPVKVLEAPLDGGGPAGSLITDDQWHLARGPLKPAGDYASTPPDQLLMTYVWLAPVGGWNVAHRTLVDRAELVVLSEEQAGQAPPAPAVHVRPRPGAQVSGDGWIWFEGEDAVEQNLRAGGGLLPGNATEQRLLANGAWLQYHGSAGMSALWQTEVPRAGQYDFWCRGLGAAFRWAWDAGEWHGVDAHSPWQDEVVMRSHGANPVSALWIKLGTVTLTAGKHLLQVGEGREPEAVGFDCWMLTQQPFTPRGPARPDQPAVP